MDHKDISGSLLPASINEYHSLVPLDLTNQKNTQSFGYPNWAYKAFSSEDGHTYALRRVEGTNFEVWLLCWVLNDLQGFGYPTRVTSG
jgi:hypothetical protein